MQDLRGRHKDGSRRGQTHNTARVVPSYSSRRFEAYSAASSEGVNLYPWGLQRENVEKSNDDSIGSTNQPSGCLGVGGVPGVQRKELYAARAAC